jgi:hypothetical protein
MRFEIDFTPCGYPFGGTIGIPSAGAGEFLPVSLSGSSPSDDQTMSADWPDTLRTPLCRP